MKKIGLLLIAVLALASCTRRNAGSKKPEGVAGKIFCIDEYRSFAFTRCGIVSTADLAGDGSETPGIYTESGGAVSCRFADGGWQDFTYNPAGNEIVSLDGNLVASGQVFDFAQGISTAAPFVGKELGASVAPGWCTWQFYDCGIAKVTLSSEGYGRTDFGVYSYDAGTGEISVAGSAYRYNAEKRRMDTYDTSVSALRQARNPVAGKTFTFPGGAQAIFTDCGILALAADGVISFYDYSYDNGEIAYYPLSETVGPYDEGTLAYDAESDTILPLIEPPEIPYTRDLKLQGGTRMNGEDVRQLQERLISLGYLAYGEDDGYFGPKTEAALKAWQGDYGFTTDGIMSQAVYNALFGLY